MKIFSRKKRAALDLSLTTIVILIFAITVLGLGLVLIRGLFQKAQERIDQAFKESELKVPPTPQDPFTISNNKLSLNRGQAATLQVAIYNVGTDMSTYLMRTLGDCEDMKDPVTDNAYFILTPSNAQVVPREIKEQETGSWGLTLRVSKKTPSGDYACSIRGYTEDEQYSYYQDFFVEVK